MMRTGTVGVAVGSALGAAAVVALVLALRSTDPANIGVLAAVGAAGLALSGLALGSAALALLADRSVASAVGQGGPRGAAGATDGARGGCGPLILDTNVIIDGRIADVCDTGFVDGIVLVPQFVLRELQHVADAADPLRRNRGRRGLDVLSRMQKSASPQILVSDRDFPLVRDVDDKLVALARETGGRIVTNDFNLVKVAELSGVTVLNLNLLANALKPAAIPGELLQVTVLKEGKEPSQGVGYLEDGTMVVVDNARRLIGRSLEVTVTSAIQTSAGRMIFAQYTPREPACGAESAT